MKINDLLNKKVLVWGLGAEGKEILNYLSLHKITNDIVMVNDTLCDKLQGFEEYPLFIGSDINQALENADIIIRSPGVSIYKPELQLHKNKTTSVTDLCLNEIKHNRPNCKLIAISGSKGKSTSVSALAFILKELGYKVGLGGNIGRPLIELIDDEYDFVVAEISSYQASDLTVSPHIAMFTNLFYVHSEWHNGHENYCKDKIHLVANQESEEIFFVNERNEQLMEYTKDISNRELYNTKDSFYADGKDLYYKNDKLLNIDDLKISGNHNLDNLSGVFSILKYLDLDIFKAAEILKNFEPLPHRLQKVATKNNVTFINDSISTAPEAAIGAVKSFSGNLVLISGGQDNLQDYTDYAKCIEENDKVKAVITLFQTGPKIAETIRKNVKRADFMLIEGDSLEKSVATAYDLLQKRGGGTILFTPTSPSFGFYKNFIERGNHFIEVVKSL
jgi:UDP-N-acetylmuramoylalanine--D-glutamate ligase